MKNLKLKVSNVVNAYQVLGEASYEKMADEDKIKVWKISKQLKPIAKKFEEDRDDAQKKLITDPEFTNKLTKAQAYELMTKKGQTEDLPLSAKEYELYMVDIKKNMILMEKALKEELDKEVDIEFEPLTEEAFSLLMASNSWKIKQVDLLDFIIE